MYMKKLLIIIIVTFIGYNVSAQTSGIANLNITLSDVLSMTVTQPSALTVDFNSEAKYTNGISSIAVGHINVVSNRAYVVKVISGVISGPSSLSSSSIKLTTSVGTTNNGNTSGITYVSSLVLPAAGGTPLTAISSTNTSWNGSNSTNKFNVEYLIGSNGAYVDKVLGSNIIPVVYSVSQP